MYPLICRIGPVNIYSWGLMVALGSLAALFAGLRYGAKEGIKSETMLDFFVYMVISAAIGARLFYVIAFFSKFRDDLISVFYVNQGGLVFLGGLCGVLITALVYVKYHKIDLLQLLDALSPGTMLGYAIGRIGCYLNGCCYGIKLFGIEQPTQIYSSVSGLIIFFLLARLYANKKYDGHIFLLALFLYSLYRFLLEFLRYNPIHILIFTPNQLLAVLMLIVSAFILWKKNSI